MINTRYFVFVLSTRTKLHLELRINKINSFGAIHPEAASSQDCYVQKQHCYGASFWLHFEVQFSEQQCSQHASYQTKLMCLKVFRINKVDLTIS